MQASELLAAVAIVVLGAVFAVMACSGLDPRERGSALISYALFVPSSFMQWALVAFFYSRGADVNEYARNGECIAQVLHHDLTEFAPEVLKLAVHVDARIPCDVIGVGTGTGTTCAAAGVLIYFVGPSVLRMCMVSGWIAWSGQVAFYRVAREVVDPGDLRAALLASFFVPSVLTWGAEFTKESLVFGAFGLVVLCAYRSFHDGRLLYLPGVVLGGTAMACIKPYTLVPFVTGLAAFVYAHRAWRGARTIRIRPLYLVLAAGLAVGGVIAVGEVFPKYSMGKLNETVTQEREGWQNASGGSDIPGVAADVGGPSQQLKMLPLGLVNALFRPTVLDARNAIALAAALETTLLTLGLLSLLGARGRRFRWSSLLASPPLVFSATFVLVFGAAVGMTTPNLGSLSRYRMPMMPFYVFFVLAVRGRTRAR